MSQPEPDTDAEEIEDEPTTELQDPDDYHKRQRLKEIHRARQNVVDKVDDLDIPDNHPNNVYTYSMAELAYATAVYIHELLPLIEGANVTESDIRLPDSHPHDDLAHFAFSMGKHDQEAVRPTKSMAAFRVANSTLADVKPLVEEDDADEWEV